MNALRRFDWFAFGVMLCAFAAEQLAGAVSVDWTTLLRQIETDARSAETQWDVDCESGGAYARQIVESLAGTGARCKAISDPGGEICGFRVALPEAEDVFSASQTRRRITQALCGIYDIEPDAVVFF